MLKTLKFGDKEVTFSTSFAWAIVYKAQFGEDPLKVLIPAIQGIESADGNDEAAGYVLFSELGMVNIANIAWAMAKLVDQDIPDPMMWIESYGDDFGVMDIAIEVLPAAVTSCFASKKSQVSPRKVKEAPKTAPKKKKA